MSLVLKGNRKYPSLPVVTDDPRNHTQVLMAIKESMEIGQRRTNDLMNSYIRVQDLVDLGLIDFEGNTSAIVGADLSQIANIGDLTGAATGDFLRYDGTNWVNDQLGAGDITEPMVLQHLPAEARTVTFASSDGALTTPVNKVNLYMPFDGVITGVAILTEGGPGDCEIDIWKDTYANFPPTLGDSIVAASPPQISSGTKYLDTTLTGWTTAVSAGDILRVSLDSVTTFTTVFLVLLFQPT